jgi:ABC-type Fe3+-hydroxamate transport system substrate-binding protein
MKKFSIALSIGLLLMVFAGCSSAPEGTVAIKDLQRTIEQQIGQKVVVVGTVDTSVAGMSITGLFRLYKGNDAVWASVPEFSPVPPQGVRVRVTGVIADKEFSGGIGRRVYIDSASVTME